MNYTYEHLEEQEEAHLMWIMEQQKWWRNSLRNTEICQAVFNWVLSTIALCILILTSFPGNVGGAFICVFTAIALHLMWNSVIESSQEGLDYMLECQGRSEQSLEDIRRLKREWRGY